MVKGIVRVLDVGLFEALMSTQCFTCSRLLSACPLCGAVA